MPERHEREAPGPGDDDSLRLKTAEFIKEARGAQFDSLIVDILLKIIAEQE